MKLPSKIKNQLHVNIIQLKKDKICKVEQKMDEGESSAVQEEVRLPVQINQDSGVVSP